MKKVTECLQNLIRPILALIIVLGAFVYFFVVLFSDHKPDSQIVIAIIGLQLVPVGYYFGGSSGATKKDETIADLAKNK